MYKKKFKASGGRVVPGTGKQKVKTVTQHNPKHVETHHHNTLPETQYPSSLKNDPQQN